jgi:hypothetical protein
MTYYYYCNNGYPTNYLLVIAYLYYQVSILHYPQRLHLFIRSTFDTMARGLVLSLVLSTTCLVGCSFAWLSNPPSFTQTVTRRRPRQGLIGPLRVRALLATAVDHDDGDDTTGTSNVLPQNDDGSFGWTDDEFQRWILQELKEEAPQLYDHGETASSRMYADVFQKASQCIANWRTRYRGDMTTWKRIFKRDRVVKEVIESIPIIHAVDCWIDQQAHGDQKVTIIDLCSGKGYLSMMLSEYLPADKVEKIVLVDKAWPMCFAEPKAHHMNWDHIYGGNTTTDGETYFTTWPIPLHTSKQDLKQSTLLRQFQKRFPNKSGEPILLLGVHLCGTLSIQAVNLFHNLPNIQCMMLKPCCLPGMVYANRQESFEIIDGSTNTSTGSTAGRPRYAFPTKDVCAPGTFSGKNWSGPPRWHLEGKFEKWCRYLQEGMAAGEVGAAAASELSEDDTPHSLLVEIPVQSKGGYQNTFLFAEKQPATDRFWEQGIPSSMTTMTTARESTVPVE